MVYYHLYLFTPHIADLGAVFELYTKTKEAFPTNPPVTGICFNRYGDKTEGQLEPHITIRFDLNSNSLPETVAIFLDSMVGTQIVNWGLNLSNPDGTLIENFNELPTTYHTAHATSSACAVRFYEFIKERPEQISSISIQELIKFFSIFLSKCGFECLNDLIGPIPLLIEDLASACTQVFKETIKPELITDKKTFTERFTHTFLNSINISRPLEDAMKSYLFDQLMPNYFSLGDI